MHTQNITLDFTSEKALNGLTAGEPLALMPASLAKKLLTNYANSLRSSTAEEIINKHIHELQRAADMDDAIQMSLDFVTERDLIKNVCNGNWYAYNVTEPVQSNL